MHRLGTNRFTSPHPAETRAGPGFDAIVDAGITSIGLKELRLAAQLPTGDCGFRETLRHGPPIEQLHRKAIPYYLKQALAHSELELHRPD